MSSRTSIAGPRRIILIQSGKYDYAELDLTRPFQIVANNNLGKTALISTLQYLYVDNQVHMSFGKHAVDESRRFYFPSDTSYVLFEIETPSGFVVVGNRGLGATRSFDLQRFYWRGPFQRDHFIHPDGKIKRWSEVEPVLSIQDGFGTVSDTAEMRRLLCSPSADSPESWGLVPLADAGDFPSFRQTFQRLLHLKDIKQDDLKELIADYAQVSPERRRIDLSKHFKTEMLAIEQKKAGVTAIRESAKHLADARGLHALEAKARALAHAGHRHLLERYSDNERRSREFLAALAHTNSEAGQTIIRVRKESPSVQKDHDAKIAEQTRAKDAIDNLDTRRAAFADYVPELAIRSIAELNAEASRLHNQLEDLPGETSETLGVRLTQLQSELEKLRQTASKGEGTLIAWMRRELGENEANRLGSLFSPGILVSVIDEGTHLKDPKTLAERLTLAADNCDAGGYSDSLIQIDFPKGAIKATTELLDPQRIARDLKRVEGEIGRTEARIAVLADLEKARTRLAGLRAEISEATLKHRDYEELQQDIGSEPRNREILATIGGEVEALKERLSALNGELSHAESIIADCVRKQQEHETEQRDIGRLRRDFPFPSGDDPGSTPAGAEFVKDLNALKLSEVFQRVEAKCMEARAHAGKLDGIMAQLDTRFAGSAFSYDASAPTEERLASVEEHVASLPELEENAENEWRALLSDAGSRFKTITDSFRTLTRRVRALSGEFHKVEFSSIESVTLTVVPNEDALNEYERHASEHGLPSLFDPTAANQQFQRFNALFASRPVLLLSDLFSLRWTIKRRDGITKVYDDLEGVESTGTTVVLKVTLNLLVLRALFKSHGLARLPFYLDEVHTLDRHNFGNILDLSEKLGFVGIFAAPSLAIGIRRYVHIVPDERGHLTVNPAHQKDILRAPGEGPATPPLTAESEESRATPTV